MITAQPQAQRLTWREAVIERIEPRTPRVVSVFLRTDLAPYTAGQHVDVRLTAPDGYQAQRSYSIASAPGAELIELAVEQLADGEVSGYFREVAQSGDAIEVRGPIGGHFIWRPEDGGPILLLAGGSGVAPLMSMVRAHAAAPDVPMLLVYSARTWEDLIFREDLLKAEAQQTGFSLVLATTRGPRGRPDDFERRLDAAAIKDILARWGETPFRAYVCGSNAFVGTAAVALMAAGIPAECIRAERFGGDLSSGFW
jgi:ferredoxin-NADP reductase